MFSIPIDSTFDASRKEQVSSLGRYVDESLGDIFERVVAVKEYPATSGQDLYELFKTIMEKQKCYWKEELVGQSYDGASNMSGNYKGLQARIKQENPRALFVWCHAHYLALIIAIKLLARCGMQLCAATTTGSYLHTHILQAPSLSIHL